jgi:hypothetical protein
MHIIVGLLLIVLLFLGCRVLWYAAICMRPRVQELRQERRAERELQRSQRQREREQREYEYQLWAQAQDIYYQQNRARAGAAITSAVRWIFRVSIALIWAGGALVLLLTLLSNSLGWIAIGFSVGFGWCYCISRIVPRRSGKLVADKPYSPSGAPTCTPSIGRMHAED